MAILLNANLDETEIKEAILERLTSQGFRVTSGTRAINLEWNAGTVTASVSGVTKAGSSLQPKD